MWQSTRNLKPICQAHLGLRTTVFALGSWWLPGRVASRGYCSPLSEGARGRVSIPRSAGRKEQEITLSWFFPPNRNQVCSDVITMTRSFLASTHNPLHQALCSLTSQKRLAFTSNEMTEDLSILSITDGHL